MMQRPLLDCFFLLLIPITTTAQFSCTFSGAKDLADCTKAIDHGDHCVWCALGSTDVTTVGFCVSEDQAEKIEDTIPTAHCNRYHGNSTADDDSATTDDDYKEPDDDKSPSDDAIPSDYWECLKEKDAKSCSAKEACKWCDTKAGYGLCMAGPSADAAANSSWYTCDSTSEESVFSSSTTESLEDPADPSCLVAFLQDPTAEGCAAAVDADGNKCEFCNFQGYQVCLNAEQAEMGEQFGMACDTVSLQDPADPSCLVAFLQDPTAEGCAAAVDADGNKCEFCNFQGYQVCLDAEQAEMGEQFGMTCDADTASATTANLQDPADPSCLVAFLQDPTADGCAAAVDADGNACEFCNFQGYQVCLNAEQAEMGEQFGMTCDASNTDSATTASLQDPADPSCLVAFLQDPTAEGCAAAVDADGNTCEFCTLQGAFQVCLNGEQAAMGEQFGISCDDDVSSLATSRATLQDPEDPSCLLAYLQDPTAEGCAAAVDADGKACEFCNLQGAFQVCLNADQAEMGEQFGLTCDAAASSGVQDPEDPSCLLAYLQDPSAEGCAAAMDADGKACEFCNLQGAFQVCLNEDQAEMGEQFGLTCDEGTPFAVQDPADPSCLLAYLQDPTADGCAAAVDADGKACEFCNLQGAFEICLNEDQAEMGEQFGLTCDDSSPSTVATVNDPADPSCLMAFLQDPTAEGCAAAVDADGNKCEFCTLQGALQVCLNGEQAAMGEQFGVTCDAEDTQAIAMESPLDDLFECLEHYVEDDCFHSSSCTWCNTQVGMGFCVTPELADSTKQFSFFDCEFASLLATTA